MTIHTVARYRISVDGTFYMAFGIFHGACDRIPGAYCSRSYAPLKSRDVAQLWLRRAALV